MIINLFVILYGFSIIGNNIFVGKKGIHHNKQYKKDFMINK